MPSAGKLCLQLTHVLYQPYLMSIARAAAGGPAGGVTTRHDHGE